MNSVQEVLDRGMCCGCGICAAVCPKQAIVNCILASGQSGPQIDEKCVNCGICKSVCPQIDVGSSVDEEWEDVSKSSRKAGVSEEPQSGGSQAGAEEVEARREAKKRQAANPKCLLGQSKQQTFLEGGTSGGFITTLVQALLDAGEYDSAFLVDTHRFDGVVQTRRIQRGDDLVGTQKSRYIQVMHTDEIAYIVSHPGERIMLVGTPCYFHGFLKVAKRCGLDRDNYLLVGLFCDKTMTAHVWEYFDTVFADGQLERLHFRSKESKGWPGEVKLFLQDGQEKVISRRERMDVKDYFAPEACLYCMDKLNELADLSVGDDYVSREKRERERQEDGRGDSRRLGRNSLILRTERAMQCWDRVKDLFQWEECTEGQIASSQHLEKREKNRIYRIFKAQGGNSEEYRAALEKIYMGQQGNYKEIYAKVQAERKRKSRLLYKVLARCRKILRK